MKIVQNHQKINPFALADLPESQLGMAMDLLRAIRDGRTFGVRSMTLRNIISTLARQDVPLRLVVDNDRCIVHVLPSQGAA
jgi:hypothetical protein